MRKKILGFQRYSCVAYVLNSCAQESLRMYDSIIGLKFNLILQIHGVLLLKSIGLATPLKLPLVLGACLINQLIDIDFHQAGALALATCLW